MSGITDKGQTSACKTDAAQIRTAVAAYQAKNNATDTPTMPQLVTAGLLQQASTLYTISYTGSTLTLTGVGNCSSVAG